MSSRRPSHVHAQSVETDSGRVSPAGAHHALERRPSITQHNTAPAAACACAWCCSCTVCLATQAHICSFLATGQQGLATSEPCAGPAAQRSAEFAAFCTDSAGSLWAPQRRFLVSNANCMPCHNADVETAQVEQFSSQSQPTSTRDVGPVGCGLTRSPSDVEPCVQATITPSPVEGLPRKLPESRGVDQDEDEELKWLVSLCDCIDSTGHDGLSCL